LHLQSYEYTSMGFTKSSIVQSCLSIVLAQLGGMAFCIDAVFQEAINCNVCMPHLQSYGTWMRRE